MRAAMLSFGVVAMMGASVMAQGQKAAPPANTAEKVIIDTDIGDDIDDAFAIALAVRSPELEILGVTTTFGDTEARARIADRVLGEAGRAEIPVLAGAATKTSNCDVAETLRAERTIRKGFPRERGGFYSRADSEISRADYAGGDRAADECRGVD